MKPEAQLSRDIGQTLKTIGCAIYSTEQGYRKERGGTRCTPGIPDLIVFGPAGRFTFAELKVGKRKLTQAQKLFQAECADAGVPFAVWRSVDDALDWFSASARGRDSPTAALAGIRSPTGESSAP